MGGLNLHDIVRRAITYNNPDLPFILYRSEGMTVHEGVQVPLYREITGLMGQFQSEGDAALNFAEMGGQNTQTRKLYLYSTDDRKTRPWTIDRGLARSGDYLKDHQGQIWQVSAVTEDFSANGWEQLRITLQQTLPEMKLVNGEAEITLGEHVLEDDTEAPVYRVRLDAPVNYTAKRGWEKITFSDFINRATGMEIEQWQMQ